MSRECVARIQGYVMMALVGIGAALILMGWAGMLP